MFINSDIYILLIFDWWYAIPHK